MKILDVAPSGLYPPTSGNTIRAFQLLRHLGAEHEVRVFSQPRSGQVRTGSFEREVSPLSRYTEYRYSGTFSMTIAERSRRAWIYQHVTSGAILRVARPARLCEWLRWADICLVEFPWQFAFCRRQRPRQPVVLASHNVEAEVRRSIARAAGHSPARSPSVRYVDLLETRAVTKADLVLAVSSEDRNRFVELYEVDPARVVEVPNGSDTGRFVPATRDTRTVLRQMLGLPDRPTIVYMAAGPKVADRVGLSWVQRVARNLSDFTFLVVGGVVARPFVEGNVVATGFVPDPVPFLQAADVSLCPIEHGGGTKLKVFDSLAVGLPSVVFDETIRGTALRHAEEVWVAEKSLPVVTDAVRLLAEDSSLGDRLGAQGRAFVVAHHDWKAIARRLEAALLGLVGAGEMERRTA